ncbi:MAG TPA: DNA polymerase I [Candidatus Saccharibacteria bacterium]|nr:DNA polymerase I [Candidatus Saccharibacteria bacterium]
MVEEEKGERKRLVIIDGKSVFYRGYYAMPNLSTADGVPTGGVFGFASMALEVMRKLKPDYVCVAWDKQKTNIRKRVEMYPEYKAGRKPAPPDFYDQIPLLHDLLDAFGWPLYELDDYEADDIMGTLAVQAKEKGIDTALVTSDLDLLQVINDNVHVYALKKGLSNIELFHPESFRDKYGIEVDQFLDLKSIKGDSSDNIPGVSGIGEKGAVELLKEHKTLDEVYDNLDLIKDSLRKKLEAGKESAYLSKKLAAIWTDAPIKLDLKALDISNCDPLAVKDKLESLQFKSLVRQLPEVMKIAESVEKQDIKDHGIKTPITNSVKKPQDLHDLISNNFVYARASFNEVNHEVIDKLYLLNYKKNEVSVISSAELSQKDFKETLSDLNFVSADIKKLLKGLWLAGISTDKSTIFDTQIAGFLLNPLIRSQTTAELAREYLDLEIEATDLEDEARLILELTVIERLHKYLVKEFDKAENKKLKEVFNSIELPIIPVLARMENAGIKLDVPYMDVLSVEIDDKISDLTQEIYGFADKEFNISSPSQLADILFDDLGLSTDGIKKGKTGYSTAAKELDKLRGQHPIIDLISQYREVTKLKNTYVDTLPTMVDKDSRIHTTFNLTIAQTGRLSSTDPNLQNIPVRTDLGKRIREAFVAEKGRVLVSADYSQFELRLAAYLSEDKELIRQFNEDVDVHQATAALIYGREVDDVTKSMRRDAKVVNFGIMYGLGPHGLVSATGMTYGQAKEFIDKFFEVRPKLLLYIDSVKKQAHDLGYVENIFGRRRPTPDVKSSNFMVRESAYRAAVNMPFQGSAADIMKKAMIEIDNKLDDDCKMLLQIHDSVIVECPDKSAKTVAKLIKDTMENVIKLPIKLTVDTSFGKTWGEL